MRGTLECALAASGNSISEARFAAILGHAFTFSMAKDGGEVWQLANIEWCLFFRELELDRSCGHRDCRAAERLDAKRLISIAKKEDTMPVVQRLGYLLELTDHGELAEPLHKLVEDQKPRFVPLDPVEPKPFRSGTRAGTCS